MNSIVFINLDINKCQMINSDNLAIDNLDTLIEQNKNQSSLIFILSKQCCFSGYLEIPNKNKSLFKKNAAKIIRQDLDQSSNEIIVINKEVKNKLPYIIVNKNLINSIADIFKRHKIEKSQIHFESSLLKSDHNEWKFLVKDNDEINIYYNGTLFTSRSSNLNEDMNVLFTQNNKPDSLRFYSLSKENPNQDDIQSFQSQNEATISYANILDDPSLIDTQNSISIKKLLEANNKNSNGVFRNWKSLNLSIFALCMTVASINYHQSSSLNTDQLEMRKANLIEYIFKNEKLSYNENDLDKVVYSIKNSNNLPNISHINTLNYIGEVFGISGVEIDQLNIKKDNSIYIKLRSTKKSSVKRLNESLQNNNYFIPDVRSIKKISDQETQMEINLNLKEPK